MRILTVSDRVEPVLYDQFDPRQFEKVELILACGDLPPEYLSFLADRLNAPLYFVRGNHDLRHDRPPGGCTHLAHDLAEFKGKSILGLEGSRWYNGGPNQYTEREMYWKIQRLRPRLWWRKGIDIVITHAPPRHIHDAEDRCHRGFKSFRWLIEKYSPTYFIHGHIHAHFSDESQRITLYNRTRVINTYGYYMFDIDKKNDVGERLKTAPATEG
jgi:Icc-related predicted phosphoesterase